MIYYLFRFLGFVCPLLPARFGYWLFARLGDLGFLLTRNRQRTYFYNLRRVLGAQATPAEVNAMAHQGYQNLLKNYFDLFRAHRLTRDELQAQLAGVQGFEYLERAVRQGKGVVAGTAHFGNFDLVMQVTAAYLQTEIVAAHERLRPESLFRYVAALRHSQGIEMVAVDRAPRAIIKALRAGHVAGLAFDRDITRTGPRVNFFGAPAQLPDGAVQLSLKYGAPVIIGFAVRQRDNRCFVYIEPPIQFEKSGDDKKDIRAGVQRIANILEKYIRRYPDQWLMFQKIWE